MIELIGEYNNERYKLIIEEGEFDPRFIEILFFPAIKYTIPKNDKEVYVYYIDRIAIPKTIIKKRYFPAYAKVFNQASYTISIKECEVKLWDNYIAIRIRSPYKRIVLYVPNIFKELQKLLNENSNSGNYDRTGEGMA